MCNSCLPVETIKKSDHKRSLRFLTIINFRKNVQKFRILAINIAITKKKQLLNRFYTILSQALIHSGGKKGYR